MENVYICDAVRTPIGRYGGALACVWAMYQLHRSGARYALCNMMCIGVGQGIAIIIERV